MVLYWSREEKLVQKKNKLKIEFTDRTALVCCWKMCVCVIFVIKAIELWQQLILNLIFNLIFAIRFEKMKFVSMVVIENSAHRRRSVCVECTKLCLRIFKIWVCDYNQKKISFNIYMSKKRERIFKLTNIHFLDCPVSQMIWEIKNSTTKNFLPNKGCIVWYFPFSKWMHNVRYMMYSLSIF